MNYLELFKESNNRDIKLGILGANGGFGFSFLAQLQLIGFMNLKVVCDLDPDESIRLLTELGYDRKKLTVCRNLDEVREASEENTLILDSYKLLPATGIDVLLESTGNPEVSGDAAQQCLNNQIHVCMVSKETDSVIGPYLGMLAEKNGVIYTTVDGDQPSNLIGLFSWVKILGLEVISAGKSSEYDYIYSEEEGTVTYLDRVVDVPDFHRYWQPSGDIVSCLKGRSKTLSMLPQSATPDYCEMNIVSNATGLVPACDDLNYPLCKVSELADIFIPEEDGGILKKVGVVDVFNNLRRPDEASFGGGVFVIVRCHNKTVWNLLAEKGHVVSQNGEYACLYLPYHIMGVEAPVSVMSAFYHGIPTGSRMPRLTAVMAAKTVRPFKKGEIPLQKGHHHIIDGMKAQLLEYNTNSEKIIPFYLLSGNPFVEDIPAGTVVTYDMIDLQKSDLHRMRQEYITSRK